MNDRKNISSGSKWEDIVGYSRAVRAGPHVYVAGTTATDEKGTVLGGDDPYQQTVVILDKIGKALNEAGARFEDVVRVRIYVTDIQTWTDVARAHREYFVDIRPVTTLVEVSALVTPEMLVEIEMEAIVRI
ncbi:MAG: RidA family protein [bacterium]